MKTPLTVVNCYSFVLWTYYWIENKDTCQAKKLSQLYNAKARASHSKWENIMDASEHNYIYSLKLFIQRVVV